MPQMKGILSHMSGGKTGFPDHTGKDTDQPLAQDHHGGTRFTGTMWISCTC